MNINHISSSSFGMLISERSQTFSSKAYRFGFNGHERDDEVSGEGNSNTAEFWQYDSRLGRRWNIDPVEKPWESSFATFRNMPVLFVDYNGDDVDLSNLEEQDRIEVENKVNPEHKDYNEEFAKKYNELANDNTTIYRFNNTHKRITAFEGGEMGSVSYEGKEGDKDVIGINYTTNIPTMYSDETALFEEVFHADQFRRGEFGFVKINGDWKTMGLDIYDEVEAKTWANKNVDHGNPLGENRNQLKKANKSKEKFAKYLQNNGYGQLYNKSEDVVEYLHRMRNGSKEEILSWFDPNTGVLNKEDFAARKPIN